MAFRIRHKPTGRYLQKRSSIHISITYVLGGMSDYYTKDKALQLATTTGVGYLYGTKKGAKKILKILTIE